MSQVIQLDFSSAPPAQGGVRTDIIPEGGYPLRVTKLEKAQASTGKPMVRAHLEVAKGEYIGKSLQRLFVLQAGPDDSNFGLQQLHAFFVACGLQPQTGQANIDLDAFVGRAVWADVADDYIPTKSGDRKISSPYAFYRLDSEEARSGAAKMQRVANGATEQPAPAPVQATMPEAAPIAAPVAASEAAEAAAPIAAAVEEAASVNPDDLDSLFE
jgi:hypothetical protein